MESFVQRKKRKLGKEVESTSINEPEDDSTDVKLAMLSSLHPSMDQDILLDFLLAHNGSVQEASASLRLPARTRSVGTLGHQTSLRKFAAGFTTVDDTSPRKKRVMSKRGTTLHLYDPSDVAEHTPCTIIHNFLPKELANDLLREMLDEATSFEKITFKLFENVVSSPHTSGLFVESYDEVKTQKTEYLYNGAALSDVRRLSPHLLKVKPLVQQAVNNEIQARIRTNYPNGVKLQFQSPNPWVPNAAFVNCYDGPQQNVGWHSDQLTYLGPRAVIGSISLGVTREFRVRKVVPRDQDKAPVEDADAEGQISIHLPHNSLLVMHAEMQEEWKHCVTAAQSVEPHPIAGNKRINITYRDYKANMHPRFTPRCQCNIPCVLRVVQRKKENHGKYFWMCHGGNVPGKENCSFFQWAEFDDDGNPIWKSDGKNSGSSITTRFLTAAENDGVEATR